MPFLSRIQNFESNYMEILYCPANYGKILQLIHFLPSCSPPPPPPDIIVYLSNTQWGRGLATAGEWWKLHFGALTPTTTTEKNANNPILINVPW